MLIEKSESPDTSTADLHLGRGGEFPSYPALCSGPALTPPAEEKALQRLWGLLYHPQPENRRKGFEVLVRFHAPWTTRLLLWMLANDQLSRDCRQELSLRGWQHPGVLCWEAGSPLIQVRLGVAHLALESGPLEAIAVVLPLVFDYNVDIRTTARQAVEKITEREAERIARLEIVPAHLEPVLHLLMQYARVRDKSVRAAIVSSALRLGGVCPDRFWKLFEHLPEDACHALQEGIFTNTSRIRIRVALGGLVVGRPGLVEYLTRLLPRIVNKETIVWHVEALLDLNVADRRKVVELLQEKGIMGLLVDAFGWLPGKLRPLFVEQIVGPVAKLHTDFLRDLFKRQDADLAPAILAVWPQDIPLGSAEEFGQLLKSQDTEVLRMATRSAKRLARTADLPNLLHLINHMDEEVSEGAAGAVVEITRKHLMSHFDNIPPEKRGLIGKILKKLDSNFVESTAASLVTLGEEEKVQLARLLRDMGPDEAATDVLTKLMYDPSSHVKATVAREVDQIIDPQQQRRFAMQLLDDEDPRVRANVLESLPLALAREWENKIVANANSENIRERTTAMVRLIELGQEKYKQVLARMLGDTDPTLQAAAIWAVGKVGLKELLPVVKALLQAQDMTVRRQAILAVARIGDTEAVRDLTPFLDDMLYHVRSAAHDAIKDRLGLAYEIKGPDHDSHADHDLKLEEFFKQG